MKIAITGSNGKVGQALIGQLDPSKFEITELDLPEYDVSNLDLLIEATKDHDAILHFAWAALRDNYLSGTVDPVNTQMMVNVYRAAV